MTSTILWSVILPAAILAVCLVLVLIHRRKPGELTTDEPTNEPVTDELVAEEQKTRQLQLKLLEVRQQTAHAQYRQDCAALFHQISMGLQEFFAQENCAEDSELCGQLEYVTHNESLEYKLKCRKHFKQPEPLTPEEETSDIQTLQCMIQAEEQKAAFFPETCFPWDELMDAMVPCLQELIRKAIEENEADCRRLLSQLRGILRTYQIQLLWYSDTAVQQDPKLRSCFWDFSDYPIPAFFCCTETVLKHIGSRGSTGANL